MTAWGAIVALLVSIALPGLHAWTLSPGHCCGAPADAVEEFDGDSDCCCHESDEPEQRCDPNAPHDHRSCEVCRLIKLAPVSADLCWMPSQGWWVHEHRGVRTLGQASPYLRRALRQAPARGPPRAPSAPALLG